MNTALFSIFLLTLAVCAISSPIGSVKEPDVLLEEPEIPQRDAGSHLRVKRFTCDVLSVEAKGVKLNDAACAIHCLTLGKRGGWCDKHRVCNCRK